MSANGYSEKYLPKKGKKKQVFESGMQVGTVLKWPFENLVCHAHLLNFQFYPLASVRVGLGHSTRLAQSGARVVDAGGG